MSRYDLWWYCGEEDRLPEWCVCEVMTSNSRGSISKIVFSSPSREEAECMLEEFQICERGSELDLYNNQESEWDYV